MTESALSEPFRILVIEDDPSISLGLRMNLAAEGYEVGIAEDGRSGLDRAMQEPWHVIILDLMLPKLNGFEIVKHMRSQGNDTPSPGVGGEPDSTLVPSSIRLTDPQTGKPVTSVKEAL